MSDDRIDWERIPTESDVVRWKLLAAGRRHILEQGLGSLTVEAIAAGAHIAKPTFYTHFASRDEYLEALRLALTADVVAAARAERPGPWEGIFGRLGRAVVGWILAHRALAPLFGPVWAGDPDRPTRRPLVTMVAEVLDAGERAGVLSLLDLGPEVGRDEALLATARFTLDVLSGTTDQTLTRYPDESPIRAMEAFLARALLINATTARETRFPAEDEEALTIR